ncbi:MAG: hypothetical protein ACI936_002996 [Paraglaciecola sp.]|jgi:hypothetical protein
MVAVGLSETNRVNLLKYPAGNPNKTGFCHKKHTVQFKELAQRLDRELLAVLS